MRSTVTITGTLVGGDGKPIAEADVTAGNTSAITGPDGRFNIGSPGSYDVL